MLPFTPYITPQPAIYCNNDSVVVLPAICAVCKFIVVKNIRVPSSCKNRTPVSFYKWSLVSGCQRVLVTKTTTTMLKDFILTYHKTKVYQNHYFKKYIRFLYIKNTFSRLPLLAGITMNYIHIYICTSCYLLCLC